MKRVVCLLMLIIGLSSCTNLFDSDIETVSVGCHYRTIELSADSVVVDSKAQAITIKTNHIDWQFEHIIDICGDKFSLDGSDFKGTYTYDNYFETIVSIDYEWFTIEKEPKTITIKLLENNTSELRTIRIYIKTLNYSIYKSGKYKIDIVQGAK